MKRRISLVVVLLSFVSISSFGQTFNLEQLNQVRPKLDFIEDLSDRLSDLKNYTASRYLFGKIMAIQELFINVYEYHINNTNSQQMRNLFINIRNDYIESYNLRLEMYNLLKSIDPQGARHVMAGYNDAKKILDSGRWEGLEEYEEYVRSANRN